MLLLPGQPHKFASFDIVKHSVAQQCLEMRVCVAACQWVAGVAVEMAGGPAVPLLPGRPDCNCFDDATLIPDECDTAESQVAFWSEGTSHGNHFPARCAMHVASRDALITGVLRLQEVVLLRIPAESYKPCRFSLQ